MKRKAEAEDAEAPAGKRREMPPAAAGGPREHDGVAANLCRAVPGGHKRAVLALQLEFLGAVEEDGPPEDVGQRQDVE